MKMEEVFMPMWMAWELSKQRVVESLEVPEGIES